MIRRVKPKRLVPGDTVGITAPAGWSEPEEAVKAAAYLQGLGLQVRFGSTLEKRYGYLAGTDEERAAEMNAMFEDPAINAIVCARGGYGSGRIADRLDYGVIRANPKIFWGYSDITFLHAAIGQKGDLVTFHGPMLVSLEKRDVHPFTLQGFDHMVRPTRLRYTEDISPLQTIVEGTAYGPLVGGNLSVLVSTLGTPYEIDTRDCLLFIEDVGEEPYRVDRMLNQLRQAGKLSQAAGVLMCDFHKCESDGAKLSLTLEQIFADHLLPGGKPALAGFKIGHSSPNITVPIGVEAVMSTYNKTLETLEPSVQL